ALVILEKILARHAVALGKPHQAALVADKALIAGAPLNGVARAGAGGTGVCASTGPPPGPGGAPGTATSGWPSGPSMGTGMGLASGPITGAGMALASGPA